MRAAAAGFIPGGEELLLGLHGRGFRCGDVAGLLNPWGLLHNFLVASGAYEPAPGPLVAGVDELRRAEGSR